jgi:hypothetical protein
MLRSRRLAADGTGLGISRLAHRPHGWGARRRFARSRRHRLGGKSAQSRRSAAQARGGPRGGLRVSSPLSVRARHGEEVREPRTRIGQRQARKDDPRMRGRTI